MRTNRLYRIQASREGKASHFVRSGADGFLAPRAICGTRLPVTHAEPREYRGAIRDDDCGRCQRVLSA